MQLTSKKIKNIVKIWKDILDKIYNDKQWVEMPVVDSINNHISLLESGEGDNPLFIKKLTWSHLRHIYSIELNDDFIFSYRDFLDWKILSEKMFLSHSIMTLCRDKIEWTKIRKNKKIKLTEEIIIEFKSEFRISLKNKPLEEYVLKVIEPSSYLISDKELLSIIEKDDFFENCQ